MKKRITIDNLKDGAAKALLDTALCQVAEDAMNLNKEAEAERKIVLTIKVKPTKDRENAIIDVQVKHVLAPHRAVHTVAHLGADVSGELGMFEHHSDQPNLIQ